MANISLDTPEDYTGEAFFSPPSIEQRKNVSDSNKTDSHTVPPLKQLRLKLQNNARIKEQKLIGKSLSSLESSIAANQQKLNQLKQLKKYLT